MSDSLSLVLLETLQTKLVQIPGVQACYLDRYDAVGENEPKPVIVINPVESAYTRQASHTIRNETQTIEVEIHAPFSTSITLSRRHDEWFSLVDALMHIEAVKIAGVTGIDLTFSTLRGEQGWLGFLLLTYTVTQIHQQGNRSTVPGLS